MIDPHELITFDGYMIRHTYHSTQCETFREAYELTEAEYQEIYILPRYSSYESFRVMKYRWNNFKKNENVLTELTP